MTVIKYLMRSHSGKRQVSDLQDRKVGAREETGSDLTDRMVELSLFIVAGDVLLKPCSGSRGRGPQCSAGFFLSLQEKKCRHLIVNMALPSSVK